MSPIIAKPYYEISLDVWNNKLFNELNEVCPLLIQKNNKREYFYDYFDMENYFLGEKVDLEYNGYGMKWHVNSVESDITIEIGNGVDTICEYTITPKFKKV